MFGVLDPFMSLVGPSVKVSRGFRGENLKDMVHATPKSDKINSANTATELGSGGVSACFLGCLRDMKCPLPTKWGTRREVGEGGALLQGGASPHELHNEDTSKLACKTTIGVLLGRLPISHYSIKYHYSSTTSDAEQPRVHGSMAHRLVLARLHVRLLVCRECLSPFLPLSLPLP